MKDFLKFTLATVTGLVLTGFLFFFLGIITLAGIIGASSQQTVQVKPHSILTLKLNRLIEERSTEDPLAMIMGEEYASIGLNDILASIKKAKANENIDGIYLEAGYYIDLPITPLEEIRRALLDFKESGKFIVAYGDNYTQKDYYLCSVADKVMLNPQGNIEWVGLRETPLFFKGLLDKAGVEMQIFKVGTYKSAVEPFIAKEMSAASREQTSVYLNSIWNRMSEDVANSRNLDKAQLNEYADQMITMSEAENFIKVGLADTLTYKDGVRSYLKQLTCTDAKNSLEILCVEDMKNIPDTKIANGNSENTIAVYYAVGEIVEDIKGMMPGATDVIEGNKTAKDLSDLGEDNKVKAVIIRVDSPGGSAFASEQIWHEVVKLKAKKPVIISMGSVAASGGYYISCAADSIFAESTTLTGSIGIFGMLPNVEGLMTEKLGLNMDVVKTNKHSDMGIFLRPMSDSEKAIMQRYVERGYTLFVKRCADGRGMSEEAIRKVAEGRVWTGETAKELGLVDQLGGIDAALKAASEKAGLENYTIACYPEEVDPFTSLMQKGKDNYIQSQLKKVTGEYYQYMNIVERLKHAAPIQAHMGFYPNI